MNKKRKGFTIVELVIVIAVIAILAAVLIPTFASLIEQARVSADTALVKNLNLVLTADEAENGKRTTMSDALTVAEEGGYVVDKLTPTSSGEIVLDSVSNRFALLDQEGKLKFGVSGTDFNDASAVRANVWKITDDLEEVTSDAPKFSYYLKEGVYADTELNIGTGIDVGENRNINIAYATSFSGTVTVRMNGGTLKVSAPNGAVQSYGEKTRVTIDAVAMNSYHEYGSVSEIMTLVSGRVQVMNGGSVTAIAVSATEKEKATVQILSGANVVKIAVANDEMKNAVSGAEEADIVVGSGEAVFFGGGSGTKEDPYQIGTDAHLRSIAIFGSEMRKGNAYYFTLTADVTFTRTSSSDVVTSFFCGAFDGQSHKITLDSVRGLANDGYGSVWFFTDPVGIVEMSNFNVFYRTGGVASICKAWNDDHNDEQKKADGVIFTNVNMGDESVKGTEVELFRNAGGFCNYASVGTLTLTGCNNYYSLYSDNAQLFSGVFLGAGITYFGTLKFENCHNYGDVRGANIGVFGGNFYQTQYENISGIMVKPFQERVIFENCSNEGTISYYTNAGLLGYQHNEKNLIDGKYVINQSYKKDDTSISCPYEYTLTGITYDSASLVHLGANGLSLNAEGDKLIMTKGEVSGASAYYINFSTSATWSSRDGQSGSQYLNLRFAVSVGEESQKELDPLASSKMMDKTSYEDKYGTLPSELVWNKIDGYQGITYWYDQTNKIYVINFTELSRETGSTYLLRTADKNGVTPSKYISVYDAEGKLLALSNTK